MPDLDGFQLAAMIREHPRFQKTAMIFISAIHLSDIDRLRGYEMGAVDYVPVPVVPEVLRAKVKVFAELYRKTRQLEQLNAELEDRVRARTAELEESHARLLESEQRRSLALAAGKMGSWDWDWVNGDWMWDDGQYRNLRRRARQLRADAGQHPGADPSGRLRASCTRRWADFARGDKSYEAEFRIVRPDGEVRWCIGTAAASVDKDGRVMRVSGVTVDITERKQAEERQNAAGARSRSPRQERAGAGAVDRAPDARRQRQGLCPRQSRDGSRRCRACIPFCRCRAGRAPRSASWSTRSSRPIPTGDQIALCGAEFSCSRRRRRRSRWRCTSLSPMRRNMARCRRVGPACR